MDSIQPLEQYPLCSRPPYFTRQTKGWRISMCSLCRNTTFSPLQSPTIPQPHFLAHRYLGLALLIPNLHLKSTLILVFSLPSTPKWGRAKRGRKATPLQSPLEHDQCPLVHLTVTNAGRPGSFPTNFLMD